MRHRIDLDRSFACPSAQYNAYTTVSLLAARTNRASPSETIDRSVSEERVSGEKIGPTKATLQRGPILLWRVAEAGAGTFASHRAFCLEWWSISELVKAPEAISPPHPSPMRAFSGVGLDGSEKQNAGSDGSVSLLVEAERTE